MTTTSEYEVGRIKATVKVTGKHRCILYTKEGHIECPEWYRTEPRVEVVIEVADDDR